MTCQGSGCQAWALGIVITMFATILRTCTLAHFLLPKSQRRCSRIAMKGAKRKNRIRTNVPAVLAQSSSSESQRTHHKFNPDTDSFVLGIDNHASFCMTNNCSHFISKLKYPTVPEVSGINGSAPIVGVGTIKWCIEDDHGKPHKFIIPQSLYVPKLTNSILSPQHWHLQLTSLMMKSLHGRIPTANQQPYTGTKGRQAERSR